MCLKAPKLPKQEPVEVADPNAGRAAAEGEMRVRRKALGYSSTLKSTPVSRTTGSVASKILFGQ